MPKFNREMNPMYVEESKQRTIQAVMSRIEPVHSSFGIKSILRLAIVPALILLVALIVLLNSPNEVSPINQPISAFESEKLAEISYISGSFIGANLTVANPTLQFLAVGDETEFETENETINLYFDTLRVFLDEDFDSLVTITELTDEAFDYKITFEVHDRVYDFYLSIDDEIITGELQIGTQVFTVSGSIEETETETSFTIEAINGTDFVHVEYKYESEVQAETEANYQIQSRINGVETQQEIKVSFEANEQKVEITDGNNEYTLQKEIEDDVVQYKLEYRINDVDGEAIIIESEGVDGTITYSYQVKEGDVEKEIENQKPQYHYDTDEDETPGNSDDSPGNDDNNPNDQSNPLNLPLSQDSI